MRLSSLLFIAPLFLVACSSTPPVEVQTPVAPVVKKAPVIMRDFASILGGNLRGQFFVRFGKGYFRACDTTKDFVVSDNLELRSIYDQITSKSEIPVYIEFTGEISFSDEDHKEIDSVVRIDKVLHMAPAKASLQCAKAVDNFLFKATGHDPYWRIDVDSEQLFFSTKASNQAYDIDTANFRSAKTSLIYATNKKSQNLELATKASHCYNLKDKEYWGYSTTVKTLWGEYNGCGQPGWRIEDQPFAGNYHSPASNRNNNTTINLVLNENHSVDYEQTVNNQTSIKTGFWKSNTPDRVVVMLTQQGNENIREEFVFNRDGLALSTTEINTNNIITSVPGKKLRLNKVNAKASIKIIKVVKAVEPAPQPTEIVRIKPEFVAQDITPTTEIDREIQKAVNSYFKIHRTDPKNTQFNAVKFDLNSNGIDDAIVLLDWCSAKNGCEMLIFEGRKGGYRFSSRISRIHAPIIVSTEESYRWQSLLIQKDSGWAQLKFDGISYPIHTRDLEVINKDDYSTGVVLFSEGKPTQWFPVKM